MTTTKAVPGSIRLDGLSIMLIRGGRTARKFEDAVKAQQTLLNVLPVDIVVRSRIVDDELVATQTPVDEAIVTPRNPDGTPGTPKVFRRERGWFFLDAPSTFLRKVLQSSLSAN